MINQNPTLKKGLILKMKQLIISILFLSFVAMAENPAFEIYQKYRAAVDAGNKEQVLLLSTGKAKEGFSKLKDLSKLQRYFKYTKETFVREIPDKSGKVRYLVMAKGFGVRVTKIYHLEDGIWKHADTISEEVKGPDDIERAFNKEKCVPLIFHMKRLSQKLAIYYIEPDRLSDLIPTYKKLEIKETDLLFKSPEDGKNLKILLTHGYTYLSEKDKVFGLTNRPVFGYYYALFDDGGVEQITIDQFKQLSIELGLDGAGKGKLKERKPFKLK